MSRRIYVSGNAKIDGETFRHGIKGSRETRARPGEDQGLGSIAVRDSGVMVARYHFTREVVPGTDDPGRRPEYQWVGWSNKMTALNKEPEKIDEANSGSPQPMPPEDRTGGAADGRARLNRACTFWAHRLQLKIGPTIPRRWDTSDPRILPTGN